MQEGRDMGLYVYVELIHFVIKQKLIHHINKLKDKNHMIKARERHGHIYTTKRKVDS